MVVSVLGQILETLLLNSEAAIVDAPTAHRIGRLLQGMQVRQELDSLLLP